MANVNAQAVAVGGTSPTMTAATTSSDAVECGDNVTLIVVSGATTANLTITTPNTVNGLAIADNVIAIPANAGTAASAPPVCIPLSPSLYADANGFAALGFSATTGIKWMAIRR